MDEGVENVGVIFTFCSTKRLCIHIILQRSFCRRFSGLCLLSSESLYPSQLLFFCTKNELEYFYLNYELAR